jgi:serine/threonine protein kinase
MENNVNKLESKYKMLIQLGQGSFGSVWRVVHKRTGAEYAVKIEERNERSRLKNEYKIYKNLWNSRITHGIPMIKDFFESKKNVYLIMQLLGKSLEDLLKESSSFDLATVLKLGIDITDLLERVHDSGYLHRDIKPNNFLIGDTKTDYDELYIMDFGLSKRYIQDNGSHIPMNEGRSLVGTARYASINVHKGLEPSRRDDLESVAYILIYFLKKRLPWQGLKKGKDDDQVKIIGQCKMKTSLDELCAGIPVCFREYLSYCKNLKFDERPDYKFLKKILFITSQKLKLDLRYQWA